jgi:hypothetical protein
VVVEPDQARSRKGDGTMSSPTESPMSCIIDDEFDRAWASSTGDPDALFKVLDENGVFESDTAPRSPRSTASSPNDEDKASSQGLSTMAPSTSASISSSTGQQKRAWKLESSEEEDYEEGQPDTAHHDKVAKVGGPAVLEVRAKLSPAPDVDRAAAGPPAATSRMDRLRSRAFSQLPVGTVGMAAHMKIPLAGCAVSLGRQVAIGCHRNEKRELVGVRHWAKGLAEALKKAGVEYEAQMSRAVQHEGLCAGTLAELVGVEALGLHICTQAVADSDKLARRFIQHTWPDIQHVFEDNTALIDISAKDGRYCAICTKQCRTKLPVPDIASGGFPCTPFTKMRDQKGSTPATGKPFEHPSYHVVMGQLPEYLKERQPHSFWIEEVETLRRNDPRTGNTYLNQLAAACKSAGYELRAMLLNHNSWVDMPRERIFLMGFRDSAGGAKAADWAVAKIEATVASRHQQGGPVGVWEVLNVSDMDEQTWLSHSKAPPQCT